MEQYFNIDWQGLFALRAPVEIVLRGSVVYLALFLLLRFVLKREAGTLGIADLLVVVLIADAVQNGMAGEYKSITEGLLLAATILFWSYALDWLGYHFPSLQKFVHPPPLPLVKQGRLLRKNMRSELITEEELLGMLRQQGVDDLGSVRIACLEGDGRLSVITRDAQRHEPPAKPAE